MPLGKTRRKKTRPRLRDRVSLINNSHRSRSAAREPPPGQGNKYARFCGFPLYAGGARQAQQDKEANMPEFVLTGLVLKAEGARRLREMLSWRTSHFTWQPCRHGNGRAPGAATGSALRAIAAPSSSSLAGGRG